MKNQLKKINFNHSFIFFLFCNIFSLTILKFENLVFSPLFCLLLILSIGVSHGFTGLFRAISSVLWRPRKLYKTAARQQCFQMAEIDQDYYL